MVKESTLIDNIRELEKKSRLLEPLQNERQELFGTVNRYAENFLMTLSKTPVFQNPGDAGAGFLNLSINEEPEGLDSLLKNFDDQVIRSGLNPASPGHFGYIPGSGLYYSALGDFLAAVTNRYSGIYAASPGAARMEMMVVRWFAHEAGYPESAAGDLTSGGSIANLSAVVAARDAFELKARNFHRAVVYLTAHTHHCVEKSVRTAGMGECVIRRVPVDGFFRMKKDQLEKMIEADKALHLIPWLVVASAGTTDTGSVDPLEEIGDIARKNKIWFHVDGAYGACFTLCSPGKKILKGMDGSDSLTMDPHKGLFVPFGTGIVLTRRAGDLHRPYQYQANYLQDGKVSAGMDEISPAEMSPELTRHFRGLRVWLALKLAGVKSFRAALEEKLLLARYFHENIQAIDGIETGPEPDLSIVIFRYVPERGAADDFNRKLLEKIITNGSIFISS
ncbi:MAG: aminotransferase class V-fold PLP-dependent enzyme, partial [Desulfobacula sp.]